MRERRILFVANRTASGPQVRDAIRARWPSRVTLLVPATPPARSWTWDEGDVRRDARRRMTEAVTELRRSGIDVRGVLGDFSPLQAIRDAMEADRYDEIVISTLPARTSRWLKQDLPARVARAFGIPVAHVVAHDEADQGHHERAQPAA
jgi:hypothetical protein